MTRWCTAKAKPRPVRWLRRSLSGWNRSGCGCIPARRGLQGWQRRGSYEHASFTFLGFTFQQRRARSKSGRQFSSVLPAISKHALKKIGAEVRSWRLHLRTGRTFAGLARIINPIVRGWRQYYGAFYRSALYPLLTRKKYKRLQSRKKAMKCWQGITERYPSMFAHWKWFLLSRASGDQDDKSRISREAYVRNLWEPGAEMPPATRPVAASVLAAVRPFS